MRRSISTPSRATSASSSTIEDWEKIGYDVPLLVNMQPAGEYLGEEYYRAGGLPAVMHELLAAGRLHGDALTVNGKTHGRECRAGESRQCRSHPALRQAAEGARRLQGAARQSVRFRDHEDQRDLRRIPPALSLQSQGSRMRSRAAPWCSTGRRIITSRIDDPALGIDEHTILFMRGAGPIGYPGSAEVVNMQPPAALIKRGITSLAVHRRRPPVRHVGLAVDPQRLAGSGGRRRPGAAEDRRPRAHRSQQRHRRYPDLRPRN